MMRSFAAEFRPAYSAGQVPKNGKISASVSQTMIHLRLSALSSFFPFTPCFLSGSSGLRKDDEWLAVFDL